MVDSTYWESPDHKAYQAERKTLAWEYAEASAAFYDTMTPEQKVLWKAMLDADIAINRHREAYEQE
jgi:hypothetical protein